MPTYQYACTDCDHAFEQVQSFSEDSLTTCPACQGRLRKIFNAVGVVFKGSGFYRTDSRTDQRTDSQSDAKSSDSTSDTTKSEASPTKAESSTAAKSGASTKSTKSAKSEVGAV